MIGMILVAVVQILEQQPHHHHSEQSCERILRGRR